MITPYEKIPDNKKYLFFKNGKAKKTYCRCISKQKISEFRRLYGRTIIQCAGLECPFYPIGCGMSNIKEFENNIRRKVCNSEKAIANDGLKKTYEK